MYDRAASHSTSNNKNLLTDIRSANLSVKGHDSTTTTCPTIGTMTIKHNGRKISHEETLYHKTYSNMISGQRLPAHTMMVEEKTAEIRLKGKTGVLHSMSRDDDGGNWIKPDEPPQEKVAIKNVEAAEDIHERYGHISYDTLKTLLKFPKIERTSRCEACEQGKATKLPAKDQKETIIRTTRGLEKLHAHLVGRITPVTPGRQYKYLLIVVDD